MEVGAGLGVPALGAPLPYTTPEPAELGVADAVPKAVVEDEEGPTLFAAAISIGVLLRPVRLPIVPPFLDGGAPSLSLSLA